MLSICFAFLQKSKLKIDNPDTDFMRLYQFFRSLLEKVARFLFSSLKIKVINHMINLILNLFD